MGERDGPVLPIGYPAQAVWVPPGPTPLEVLAGTAAGIGSILAAPLLRDRLLRTLGVLHGRPAGAGVDASDRQEAGSDWQAASEAQGEGDPGWFGPDSVAWRVHADPSMFVAGVAAFAL
ncbi:MAG: hypothetical protein J2P58_09035, partial [Acidimicrobiaceae bacterium]|nr:hypothetical protein [Acidimicrobiaceae bacterium]